VVFVLGPLTYRHLFTTETQPLCLQELHIFLTHTFITHGFRAYCYNHIQSDRASGMMTIFTWNSIYSAPIQLQTMLQAADVCTALLALNSLSEIFICHLVSNIQSCLNDCNHFVKAKHMFWSLDHINDRGTIVAGVYIYICVCVCVCVHTHACARMCICSV
jgi:hypothetical protein